MKVFLKGYVKKNLGDDLFLKLISNRYPNVIFSITNDASYLNCNNFTYFNKEKYSKFIYLLDKLFLGRIINNKKKIAECDCSVLIGGSMYIEKKNLFKRIYSYLKIEDIYDFILGINFGPFYSNLYLNKYKKVFSKSKSVSFRDSHSFNLFSNLNNVSFFPDIVFSYDVSKYINNYDKVVVVSVIDCFSRFNDKLSNNYLFQLKKIINHYLSNNYKICLMSFCKTEGDEKAINQLIEILDNPRINKNISIYFYDGNVEEALNILSNSEIIVGSRFHANILGIILNKKVLPIIYSDKMINVLNDLNFHGIYYDIRDKFNVDNYDLNNNVVDCSSYAKESANHFTKLDNFLLKEDK